MPLDLPPQLQERVACSITAAVKYEVPANIVLAVAEKEGGKPGQWVKNSNGTHDVGAMQFNTAYLVDLRKYGITADDVAQAGCYAYDLAAWRLRGHLRNDSGDVWTRAANYHSRTPEYNAPYRADLMHKAAKWGAWIEARFVTYDATEPGDAPTVAAAPATDATPGEASAAAAGAAQRAHVVKVSASRPRYNAAAARALAAVYAPSSLRSAEGIDGIP